MASQYRRVEWKSSLVSEGHTSEPTTQEVTKEGWFHHATDKFLAMVELDNGKMEHVAFINMTFITPPNVDMETVCGTCGRVMKQMKETIDAYWPMQSCVFHYHRCINQKCNEYVEQGEGQ